MLDWRWCRFEDLSGEDLYTLLRARQQVFVVEQNCAYLDLDGLDKVAWHLLGLRDATLLAYLRVLPPGSEFPEASMGRVLVAAGCRGQGLGRALTGEALEHIASHFPGRGVRISAQEYLTDFYTDFGFVAVSEPYDEDGIPHVQMLRQAP